MNNSPENSSRQNSSIGNNNLGRHIDNNDGQGSSSSDNNFDGLGGNNGVQGSYSGETPVSNSSSRELTLENIDHIVKAYETFEDEDKFAKVKESLIRERDAYRKNNPRGAVTFSDLGYQFWTGRAKGSVIV